MLCAQSDLLLLRNDFNVNEYSGQIKDDFVTKWNKEINGLRSIKTAVNDLEMLFDHNATLGIQKTLIFRIVSCIEYPQSQSKCSVTSKDLAAIIHRVVVEDYLQSNTKVAIMRDLSILELSLIIAIKHHSDIYDRDPFNFEIILSRLHKFQSSGEFTMDPTDRGVVLKAFDVLKVIVSPLHNLI